MIGKHPIIDLRNSKAFRAFALPGAKHLGARSFRDWKAFEAELDRLWSEGIRVLYDQKGELKDGLEQLPRVQYLDGGIDAWQSFLYETFETGPSVILLGGLTGVGKTDMLDQLRDAGEQVIDLEEEAQHRGSVFGNLWSRPQLPNGDFHFSLWQKWTGFDSDRPVWIEEEGRFLGQNSLPVTLFQRMQRAPMVRLEMPLEQRLDRIVASYGQAPAAQIITAITRLTKRMGVANAQRARHFFEAGRVRDSFGILLQYYDSTYQFRRDRDHEGTIISAPFPHSQDPQFLIEIAAEL